MEHLKKGGKMKYYILCLNNNENSNKTKIADVKHISGIDGIPETESFESLEILAYSDGKFLSSYMIDVITGKKIYLDDGNLSPNLTYKSKLFVNDKKLIELYQKYKSLSCDDILRYKDGINKIEEISRNKYNSYIEEKINNKIKYENAFNYLSKLGKNVI